MKLGDLVKLAGCATMYRLVDATKVGYMNENYQTVICDADGSYVRENYRKCDVVGCEPTGKGKLTVYVKWGA